MWPSDAPTNFSKLSPIRLFPFESAVNEIEELERDTNTITTEYSEVPSYPEKVQKYLLVNGNNMQVENIEAFTRHLGGDMSKIQEAHDKRIIVKIQKPTLGLGWIWILRLRFAL